ncbi:MAG: hypothetical protein H5U40_07325 [Polyangiaceae bacterium]|nr:hypothetical protein [Polyangiaceae bacterium]
MATRYEDDRFGALVAALRLVASEPEQQKGALPSLREIAEAIRRGDPMTPFGNEVAAIELPEAVGATIAAMDAAFDALVEGEGAFTEQALAEDLRWGELRALARGALDQLGLRRCAPSLRDLGIDRGA